MPTDPSTVAVDADVLNLKQVARLLGVHYVTAYRYVRHGELPAWREGSVWLVARADVDAFVDGRQSRGDPHHRPADALAHHLSAADEVAAWRMLRGQAASPIEAHTALLAAAAAALRAGHGDAAIVAPVVRRLVDRLGALAVRSGRPVGTVAVAPPQVDPHAISAPVAVNLLRVAGWRTIELAPTSPGAGRASVAGWMPVERDGTAIAIIEAPTLSLADGALPDLAPLLPPPLR
jgi:excisionase family DNA binding protein